MDAFLKKVKKYLRGDNISSRAGNALVYGFVGAGVSKACILCMNILLSNILGQEVFGEYSLVNSTIQTFVTFAAMGVGASLVRYTAAYREEDKNMCGRLTGTLTLLSVGMSIAVSIAVFSFSGIISTWVSDSNELAGYFKIASAVILIIAVSSLCQSILLGYECNRTIARNEVLYGFASIFIVCLAANRIGIIGALLGILSARLIGLVLMLVSAKRESQSRGIRWRVSLDPTVWSVFKSFTFPAFVSSVFVVPVSWVLNSLLVKNSGYDDMAVYAVSVQWVTIITYITQIFTRVRPIYVQLYENRRTHELKKLLLKMVAISSAIGLPIAIFGAIGSKLIMGFYGDTYVNSYQVFSVMMIAAVFITLQSQFGAIFEATGKMWTGFLLNIVWAVNLFIIFELLISKGALGYSVAYLLSYILHCLFSWIAIEIILRAAEKGKN